MRLRDILHNFNRALRFQKLQRSKEVEPSRRFQNLRQGWLVVIISLTYLLIASKLYPQSTYVPLNHWVYDFLERLETKHVIQGVLNGTKPLSRMEIAEYLAEVHRKFKQGYRIKKVEQDQLNFLNIEFNEELKGLIGHLTPYQTRINRIRNNKIIKKLFPKIFYQNDRNLFSWSEAQFQIFVDPILYYHRVYNNTDSLDYTEKDFQCSSGFRIRGNVGDRLGFLIDVRDSKEWGTKTYRIGNYTLPRLGFVRATSPDFIYHDETVAYLKLGFEHVQLIYGKFSNYWGIGYTGSLILSDYATSYDQFKLEFIYKKFKLTSLYAYLIDYEEHEQDILQEKKYLAAHRLEFALWRWLSLGFSETVVFKGRSFEPAYLNPIMFFRSAEHYLGSPDNMMMGIDIKCNLIKNTKFYSELLIDDITTTKLGTDWYGNKLGYLAGIFWVDPLQVQNTDLRIEYARIQPYVYSHHNSLSYKHYDSLIGHRIGPNSDDLYVELNYRFSRCAKLTFFSEFWRHGANLVDKNVGGDIDQPHISGDDLYVSFLDGNIEKKKNFGVKFSYEVWRNVYIQVKYLRVELRSATMDNGARSNFKTNQFGISIELNK